MHRLYTKWELSWPRSYSSFIYIYLIKLLPLSTKIESSIPARPVVMTIYYISHSFPLIVPVFIG